jgi:hypothetical protein
MYMKSLNIFIIVIIVIIVIIYICKKGGVYALYGKSFNILVL